MRKHTDNYEWWANDRRRGSWANVLLPYLTAAIFLGGLIYAVLKWRKIL